MTREAQHAAVDGPVSRRDARERRGRGWKIFLRDIILIFFAALLVSFLVKTFLVRSFYIPSSSMEHTLIQNDRIIVNELEPRLIPLTRGDVVVFRDPGGWLDPVTQPPVNVFVGAVDAVLGFVGLSASDSNDHLIKRIIGLPGDTVICCDDFGRLTVNDVPLDEPYISLPDGVTRATREDFEVTVPADKLWVMGDNRYVSADSAFHRNDPTGGFVPMENVVGRAMVISWPIARWAWLDDYPLTFQDVPAVEPDGSVDSDGIAD